MQCGRGRNLHRPAGFSAKAMAVEINIGTFASWGGQLLRLHGGRTPQLPIKASCFTRRRAPSRAPSVPMLPRTAMNCHLLASRSHGSQERPLQWDAVCTGFDFIDVKSTLTAQYLLGINKNEFRMTPNEASSGLKGLLKRRADVEQFSFAVYAGQTTPDLSGWLHQW